MICVKFTAFCDLRIRLATFRNSVRKFCFCKLALTCVDLRRLASLFGQGFHLSRCTHSSHSTENYQTYGVTCASHIPARSNSFHIIFHLSLHITYHSQWTRDLYTYALWIWRSVLPYYSVAMLKVHTPRMGLIVKLCLFAILLQQGKSDKSSGLSSISAVNFS